MISSDKNEFTTKLTENRKNRKRKERKIRKKIIKQTATDCDTADSPPDVMSPSSGPNRLETPTDGATEFVFKLCAISGLRAGLCVLLIIGCFEGPSINPCVIYIKIYVVVFVCVWVSVHFKSAFQFCFCPKIMLHVWLCVCVCMWIWLWKSIGKYTK